VEILKQGQYSPITVEKQVLIIYAANEGFMDDLPVEQCRPFEVELYRFVENAHPGLLNTIREKKSLDDALKGQITSAIKEFKARFVQEQQAK
jgi:F-type H+/Na+-transporting ATPase subunit alpha